MALRNNITMITVISTSLWVTLHFYLCHLKAHGNSLIKDERLKFLVEEVKFNLKDFPVTFQQISWELLHHFVSTLWKSPLICINKNLK